MEFILLQLKFLDSFENYRTNLDFMMRVIPVCIKIYCELCPHKYWLLLNSLTKTAKLCQAIKTFLNSLSAATLLNIIQIKFPVLRVS